MCNLWYLKHNQICFCTKISTPENSDHIVFPVGQYVVLLFLQDVVEFQGETYYDKLLDTDGACKGPKYYHIFLFSFCKSLQKNLYNLK